MNNPMQRSGNVFVITLYYRCFFRQLPDLFSLPYSTYCLLSPIPASHRKTLYSSIVKLFPSKKHIMPSRSSPVYDMDSVSGQDIESGYVSGSGSEASIPELYFTKPHLQFLNRQLQTLEPQGIISTSCMCRAIF